MNSNSAHSGCGQVPTPNFADSLIFNFGSERLSDVTVHYRSASYNMHQYVLTTNSQYFDTLLSSDKDPNECHLTARCSGSRRCVTLEGEQIGGTSVTADELNAFFQCLYAETSSKWRETVMNERQKESSTWPKDFYMMKLVDANIAADEATLDCYEFDGIRKHVAKSAMVNGGPAIATYKVGQHFYSFSLLENIAFHLADYFQCQPLMDRYARQAKTNIDAIVLGNLGETEQPWRILLQADRYGWKEARETCIEVCSKDTKCGTYAEWPLILAKLKPSTMGEVFVKSVSRKT